MQCEECKRIRSAMACLSARQDPHTGTRGTGGHWSGIVSLSHVNAGP